MKKLFLLFLFITSLTFAQENISDQQVSIIGEFGLNRHGTGDITGFSYGLRVHKPLSEKFDFIVAFEANLNDRKDTPFFGEDLGGNTYDGTLHDVLAGFQLNFGVGYNFINNNKSKFGINPSVFGRYQANSALGSEILNPIVTDYPLPIRVLSRYEKGSTYAIGYSVRLYYHYKISDKFLIGISPGFQNDSQGDTMLLTTLMFGLNL
ncbi:hypothetical protein JM83_0340 [Gillisia sp. Hel_I_86]|uniref:hypothetical protein n=1 Tax=Gillisia sp. Hel_I_86 TaxID=1249981 RepID=UPI001199774A|nr:hypothetical protein [Gillisia sp. Hel_I_86]TVZ25428.1 hypothetical protein JM83_0340 [Gillisia sp. Hel_I_86]